MVMQCQDVFTELMQERRSVRGYTKQAASQDLLDSVFAAAARAPSNCNTQPWMSYVLSGAACERVRERVFNDFSAGKMSMDFPYDGVYQGEYKNRQHGAAQALYDACDIGREDKAKRQAQFMKNFRFFDAPHVCFLFLPEPFGIREAADLGMYAQSLMLSLSAHGMASCPQTALSFTADAIREELDIPAEQKLLFGISFGFEDEADPANGCKTERDIAGTTRFIRD